MASRSGQRTFRLTEDQATAWDRSLELSGLSQQKAMETLVEALGAGLIELSTLRAELVKRAHTT